MITAIDTNVLIALWDVNDVLNVQSRNALFHQYQVGDLIICGAVFAELLGSKNRTIQSVEKFLEDTSIIIDWTIDEAIWRNAANALQNYTRRRRKQKQSEPRRFVTDFLIGAHAFERGFSLLTFDDRIFKAAFPKLRIVK